MAVISLASGSRILLYTAVKAVFSLSSSHAYYHVGNLRDGRGNCNREWGKRAESYNRDIIKRGQELWQLKPERKHKDV